MVSNLNVVSQKVSRPYEKVVKRHLSLALPVLRIVQNERLQRAQERNDDRASCFGKLIGGTLIKLGKAALQRGAGVFS